MADQPRAPLLDRTGEEQGDEGTSEQAGREQVSVLTSIFAHVLGRRLTPREGAPEPSGEVRRGHGSVVSSVVAQLSGPFRQLLRLAPREDVSDAGMEEGWMATVLRGPLRRGSCDTGCRTGPLVATSIGGMIYVGKKGSDTSFCAPSNDPSLPIRAVIFVLPVFGLIASFYLSFLHCVAYTEAHWCSVPSITVSQIFVIAVLGGWVGGCLASFSMLGVALTMIGVMLIAGLILILEKTSWADDGADLGGDE